MVSILSSTSILGRVVPGKASQLTNSGTSTSEGQTSKCLAERLSCAQHSAANTKQDGTEKGDVAFACLGQLVD